MAITSAISAYARLRRKKHPSYFMYGVNIWGSGLHIKRRCVGRSGASGQAQGMERRREQDEITACRGSQCDPGKASRMLMFFYQLQAQTRSRQEMAFRQRQYEELPEQQQLLGQIENDLRKDFTISVFPRHSNSNWKRSHRHELCDPQCHGRYSPGDRKTCCDRSAKWSMVSTRQKSHDMPWPKSRIPVRSGPILIPVRR